MALTCSDNYHAVACSEICEWLTRWKGVLVVGREGPNGPPRYPAPNSPRLVGYIEPAASHVISIPMSMATSATPGGGERNVNCDIREGSGHTQGAGIRHPSRSIVFRMTRSRLKGHGVTFIRNKMDGCTSGSSSLPRKRIWEWRNWIKMTTSSTSHGHGSHSFPLNSSPSLSGRGKVFVNYFTPEACRVWHSSWA